jgi:hypothetical protein
VKWKKRILGHLRMKTKDVSKIGAGEKEIKTMAPCASRFSLAPFPA